MSQTTLRVAHRLAAAITALCFFGPDRAGAQAPDGSYAQLHAFKRQESDALSNHLLRLPDGRIVGTGCFGGERARGTVFALKSGSDTVRILHTFQGSPIDGDCPTSMIIGPDGGLWGMTVYGGEHNAGTIFTIAPDGRYRIVHSFVDEAGALPGDALTLASDGHMYGTTTRGGLANDGTVFRVEDDGSVTILWHMQRPETSFPIGRLLQASNGRLYGTSAYGGTNEWGSVFSLATDGSDRRVLHDFSHFEEGSGPIHGLVEGSDGLLYGTLVNGGHHDRGTAYRLDLDGGNFRLLHAFRPSKDEGANPACELLETRPGVFFGTTRFGGRHDRGTVFQILASGEFTTVYRFTGDLKPGGWVDGAVPATGLTAASDGALVGVTYGGGVKEGGTVFKLRLH